MPSWRSPLRRNNKPPWQRNAASSGLVEAFLHDLTVQRKPANLATLSA